MIHRIINHCPKLWRYPLARFWPIRRISRQASASLSSARRRCYRASNHDVFSCLDNLTARADVALAVRSNINQLYSDGCVCLVYSAIERTKFMTTYAQLSLLESPSASTAGTATFEPVRDVHYGLWKTRYGKRPWGWEGYGKFEHLYGGEVRNRSGCDRRR